MRYRIISVAVAVLFAVAASAQTTSNEVRIGWGDMFYESAVFHNTPSRNNYHHTGHFFAEYQRNLTKWLGVGFEADIEGVNWTNTKTKANDNFYNLCLFPTVRFTYFRKGIVTMYSGLGFGLNINGGSETDYLGRKTVCAPLINITAYAISLNWNNLFGTFEIGGLNAENGKNEVFMAGSRILSISFGYRF